MDDKSGSDLPRQDVHSREEKAAQVRRQHVFIEALRLEAAARGDKGLDATADALQQQYRAADHSRLQEDVYLSSAHRPASPGLGYFRASEHVEMLNKLGVNWTAAELKKYLQPDDSLAAEMRLAGGSRVDHVAMSQDGHTVFGVQGRLDDPAHVRVSVDTVTAMHISLSQSTERVAMADAQRSQAIPLELQQEQLRTMGPRLA